MISRLPRYDDSIGDDSPYNSLRYGRIPEGHGFDALQQVDDCPLTNTMWDVLIRYAKAHYRNWEIIGDTIADFDMNLQDAYETRADTFERLLEVYDGDIAKPILGRSEVVTYDVTNQNDANGNNTGESVNVPLDAPADDKPNQRDKSNEVSHNTNKQTGSVTTELSDLGVRPNYESLNGFLDNNRTAKQVFADIFRDCFTLLEYETF